VGRAQRHFQNHGYHREPRGVVQKYAGETPLAWIQNRQLNREKPPSSANSHKRDQNNANVRITSGTRPSARALVDARSAVQTAQEEAQGAGLVNFGMVVTATVTDKDRLPDAVAAIEQTSGTARVLLRRAYGAQDTAFAASLPLGLVLPKHSLLPSEIRDAL
jgi:hypothetical protein